MGQDIAKQDAPRPVQKSTLAAGGTVLAIVPQTFEDVLRLAGCIHVAGITPEGLDTPDKIAIALMAGAEAGLAPMASVQGIMIVNKRPAIWGDAALALVRSSGICEWIEETIEGEVDKAVAICRIQRKGEPRPIERRFSVEDAKKAGLWGKTGPWQKYPTRMLGHRARAWALRDGFADVLKGLHIVEEARDVEPKAALVAPSAPVEEEQSGASPRQRAEESAASSTDDGPPSVSEDEDGPPVEGELRHTGPITEGDYTESLGDLPENFVDDAAQAMQSADGDFDLETYWIEAVEPWWDKIDPPDKAFLEKVKAAEEKRRAP